MLPSLLPKSWEHRIFLVLTLLYLLPIWLVTYFPSQDGPSHVYNAVILKEYNNTESYPLFQQYYDLNLTPMPNWLSHAGMMLLMFVFSPLIAEKILVSGYVLLLLLGVWYFIGSVDREKRWYAFLMFPFVYNYLLQMGFYNFCYSLAFFLYAIGYWWKHRSQFNLERALTLNLILVLAYFSHPVSIVLALFSIAVLWLLTLRRHRIKRHLLQIPMLLPACVLPLWFIWTHGTQSSQGSWTTVRLKEYLLGLEVLYSFSETQLKLGFVLIIFFWVFHVMTFFREKIRWTERGPRFRLQREDGFLLLSVIFIILFFLVPDGLSGGGFMKHRLSLYPFLILLPWFSARLGKYIKWGSIGILTLLAVLNLGYLLHWYSMLDADMQEFRAGIETVEPNHTIMPLAFDRNGRCDRIGMFLHAIGYYCAFTGGVEWDNYEATTDYFPIRYKPGLNRPDTGIIEGQPQNALIAPYADLVDYIHTWAMPPDSPIEQKIEQHYTPVFAEGRTRIYKRKQ